MCEVIESESLKITCIESFVREKFNELVEYFRSNGIPSHVYGLNSHPQMSNSKTSYNIVIPGGIVIIRCVSAFMNSKSIDQLDSKIEKIRECFPAPKLFVYIVKPEDNTTDFDMDYYYDTLGLDSENDKIRIVTDVSQFDIKPYVYVIDKCGSIVTLANDDITILELFNTKSPIYIIESMYNYACVFLSDRELENLKRYNFELIKSVDSIPSNVAVCTLMNKSLDKINIDTCSNVFTLKVKNVSNCSGRIKPIRVVDGITDVCLSCSRVTFVKHISSNKICRQCLATTL
jgi:hypothetical protein